MKPFTLLESNQPLMVDAPWYKAHTYRVWSLHYFANSNNSMYHHLYPLSNASYLAKSDSMYTVTDITLLETNKIIIAMKDSHALGYARIARSYYLESLCG